MKKKYTTSLLCFLFFLIFCKIQSQEVSPFNKQVAAIDGLFLYPNPASGEKIFISSTLGLTKQIKIYDVLGKKILFKVLVGEEMDISALNSGVYYVEITEREKSEAIKLVVL